LKLLFGVIKEQLSNRKLFNKTSRALRDEMFLRKTRQMRNKSEVKLSRRTNSFHMVYACFFHYINDAAQTTCIFPKANFQLLFAHLIL